MTPLKQALSEQRLKEKAFIDVLLAAEQTVKERLARQGRLEKDLAEARRIARSYCEDVARPC